MLFNKILLILFLFSINSFGKQVFKSETVFKKPVLVGVTSYLSTADDKAILELKSTTKGFLPPRMTEAQRDAISSPPTGLSLYNLDAGQLQNYTGAEWVNVAGDGADPTVVSPASGGVKVVSAEIDGTGTVGITQQDGTWLDAIIDNGGVAGNYTLDITSETFSAKPICTCTTTGTSNRCAIATLSTTNITNIRITDDDGAATDDEFWLICVGGK